MSERQIVCFEIKGDTAKRLDRILDILDGYPLLTGGLKGTRSIVLRLCVDDIYELFFGATPHDEIINPNFKEKSEIYRIIRDKRLRTAFEELNEVEMSVEEEIEAIATVYKKVN